MATTLEEIVKIFNQVYADSSVQICDTSLYFRFVGNKILHAFNIDKKEILNKKLIDVNSPVKHLTSQYKELNQPVLQGKISEATYITYVRTGSTLLIAKNIVKPIIIEGKIVGLLIDTSIVNNVLNFNFDILENELSKKTATIITNHPDNKEISFSETEELITFLIVIGKVDKEISEILQSAGIFLSRAGISKVIARKLFPKLGVKTRNQFITQVFYHGLIHKLPDLLLNNKQLFNLSFGNSESSTFKAD